MKIGGYKKKSFIDFPGKVAAVVYTQGCDWRCPFCHNHPLTIRARFQPAIPEHEIFADLTQRQSQLDAVVVTGGEPTLQHGLADFFRHVRQLGFLTKLDTNGSHPEVLAQLLNDGLLDSIAMDIKGPLCDYARFTGCQIDTGPIELSIELIKNANLPYEFRTTLVGGLHTQEHIAQLAPLLHGIRRYTLQSYRPAISTTQPKDAFSPPDAELLHTASEVLRNHVEELMVR